MLLELGSLRLATGRHATPPPSPAIASEGPQAEVAKALPAGAVITRDLSEDAKRLGTGTAASQGTPTDPGPLPAQVVTDRPPQRFNFQHGYNRLTTPGRGKLAPFAMLRALADISSLIRICIETRKDQVDSLEWDIAARDKKAPMTPAMLARINAARRFFAKPDGQTLLSDWNRKLVEEVLVIDALSIYRRPTKGGQLCALELIDGATIVPLLDAAGKTPASGVAYRQIISGQPVQGGDCTAQQLTYRPRVPRVHTPYGLSPTEAVLLTVNAALNRETFNLGYFREGNIPRAMMDAPEGYTPTQIEELQKLMDDLVTSNPAILSRIRIVGHGMTESMKLFAEPNWQTDQDEWYLKLCCAAFAVLPAEIGFTADVNRSTGESQENVTGRRGIKPMGNFIRAIFNDVLTAPAPYGLDLPDLQAVYNGGEVEDKLKEAQVDAIYLARGVRHIDGVRGRLGEEPIGANVPTIDTPMGPVPVTDVLASIDDPDAATFRRPAARAAEADDVEDDDTSQADLEAAAKADLRKWKTVATKAVREGRTARLFKSSNLPAELKLTIRLALLKAKSAADVTGIFDPLLNQAVFETQIEKSAGKEYRTFLGAARIAQARIRRHFAKGFEAQGAALAAHLASGEARA